MLSTLTVTSDGDSGKGTLRAEIAAASSGDTIHFAPSAYGTISLTSGPLVVPDINLSIQGPGANKLTISGNGTYTVLELGIVPFGPDTPSTMTISGLTIANGNASTNASGGNGGGIAEAVNLTVNNSVFKNDIAPTGSGGAISDSSAFQSSLGLTLNNDLLEDNTSGSASIGFFRGQGGAIDAENGSNVIVNASTFIDNQSIAPIAEGGAISLTTNPYQFPNVYGSLSVTGSTFRGNTASSSSAYGCCAGWAAAGGAIWTDPQVALTVGSSRFIDNEAELAVLTGNPGVVSGGAIAVNPGTYAFPTPPPSATTITNSVFSGNMAVGTGTSGTQAQGGAINAGGLGGGPGGGTITIIGSTFIANQAKGDSSTINVSDETGGLAQGGAINTYLDALALTSDNFTGNQALGGSGLSVDYASGGAINSQLYTYDNPYSTLTTMISSSTFTWNQAIGGAGVTEYSPSAGGGALTLTDTPASISGSSFLGNQALASQATGASPFLYYGPLSTGGAIDATGSALSIQGGVVSGNEARGGYGGDAPGQTGGAGGYAWGGGVFVDEYSPLTMSGTAVTGNSALGGAGGTGFAGGAGGYGQGGGVYIYYGDSASISNSTITGNTAVAAAGGQGTVPGAAGDAQGGGLFEYAAILNISGGSIIGNSAVGGEGGGSAQGGGVYNSGYGADATLTGVSVSLNSAIGGQGNSRIPGGDGQGGGLFADDYTTLNVTGGLIMGNSAVGGSFGGNGQGGGVYTAGTANFSDVLIALNFALGGSGGGQGVGGGLYIAAGTVTLASKTKVVGNLASTSNDNIYGPYTTS